MADIIPLGDKIQQSKTKQAALNRMRKIAAVQRMYQCSKCPHRCEKCGIQIHSGDSEEIKPSPIPIPYRFCASCTEEYQDYVERLKGKTHDECYWHNEFWIDNWKKWIEFKSSTDRYINSKEFKQLLEELKRTVLNE